MERVTNQQLVDRLTQRMNLHRIFLFSYPYEEEQREHLLLIVNPIKGLSPETLAPIVSLCMSDGGEISFDLVLTGEWQNQLKQGSLYYTYASLPKHELYAATKKGNPLFAHKTINGLLELAEVNYEKSRKVSDEFREGADNFLLKADYGQATFMLHQFMEFRLKGFLTTTGIKGGKSRNIEHLMKRIRNVAPQLQGIFPYDGPSADLFRLLDQSYVKARKQETIDITEEEFDVLKNKCEFAKVAMDDIVASMVTEIKAYQEQLPKEVEKSSESSDGVKVKQNAETVQVSQIICEGFSSFPWPEPYKRDVNALLDRIHQTHRPEQIIMLNYHTDGFSGNFLSPEIEGKGSKVELYLVVLKNNKGPFNFNCIKVGYASAMVLYLNIKTVKTKLEEGDRFVNNLWTRGLVLRKKSTFNPDFTIAEVNWALENEQAKEVWKNAKMCIDNLNKAIQTMSNMTLDTELLLTNNLLQIGVHTYLQCAVGYVPYEVHLTELMDWTGTLNRKLIDYFNPKSDIEKERLRLALTPENVWWKNIPLGLSETSLTFHCIKANEIVHFFEEIVSEVLGEIERKIDQSQCIYATNVLSEETI